MEEKEELEAPFTSKPRTESVCEETQSPINSEKISPATHFKKAQLKLRSNTMWQRAREAVNLEKMATLSDRELSQYKVICFALMTVILIMGLFYFNYLLLGEFFTCIFLALVCSLALRPFKDGIVNTIICKTEGTTPFSFWNSLIMVVILYIFSFCKKGQKIKEQRKLKRKTSILKNAAKMIGKGSLKAMDFGFEDVYLISLICVVYILYFKVPPALSWLIVIAIVLIDLAFRLINDTFFILIRKIGTWTLIEPDRTSLSIRRVKCKPFIHSFVSLFIIISTAVLLIFVCISGCISVIIEIKNLGVSLGGVVQSVSTIDFLKDTFGEDEIYGMLRYSVNSYGHSLEDFEITINYDKINGPNEVLFEELLNIYNQTKANFLGSPPNQNDTSLEPETEFSFTHFMGELLPLIKQHYDKISNHASKFMDIGTTFLTMFAKTILYYILEVSLEIANLIFMLILFMTCLMYFLSSESNMLHSGLSLIPIGRKKKTFLEKSLIGSIEGVFLSSFKILIYHSIFTWLTFDFFEIHFKVFYTIVAAIITIIPLFSPWMLSIPSAIQFYFKQGNPIKAVSFLAFYSIVITYVDTLIMKKTSKATHPYMLGMSIAFGMYAFGIIGVIYGPLLVCTSIVIYDFSKFSYNLKNE